MQSKLQGDKEFWAPVSIALGVTALLNFVYVSLTSINGLINFICGLALIVVGILLAPSKNRKFWSRLCITAGFSLFFFGISMVSSNQVIGWAVTGFALILLFGIGLFWLAPS